jgi:hypothetical protein
MSKANRWMVEVRFTCASGRVVRHFYMVDGASGAQACTAARKKAMATTPCERAGLIQAEIDARSVQAQKVVLDPLWGVALDEPFQPHAAAPRGERAAFQGV